MKKELFKNVLSLFFDMHVLVQYMYMYIGYVYFAIHKNDMIVALIHSKNF